MHHPSENRVNTWAGRTFQFSAEVHSCNTSFLLSRRSYYKVLTSRGYVFTLKFTEEKTIPTDKRAITFYADPEIGSWYEAMPTSVRSRTINELLKKAISAPDEKVIAVEKIEKHESVLRELVTLVTILSQEQIVACEVKSKNPQAKALKKRLKTVLGQLEQSL